MTEHDAALVKKAQKGDDTAYIELFGKYEKQLYRTAFIYVKNEHDALDVVQETAYRSFKSLRNLREPAMFQTWLVKICISYAIDVLRQSKKVVLLEDIEADEKHYNSGSDFDFLQALSNLQEEEKNVVILKYYYDYTFEKISRILKIPLGTAKSILYRALKKLKLETVCDNEKEVMASE